MTITIHNTTKIVELDGIQTRIWEGRTDTGIPVHCFVARIAAPTDADQDKFKRELLQTRTPSKDLDVYPLRLVL